MSDMYIKLYLRSKNENSKQPNYNHKDNNSSIDGARDSVQFLGAQLTMNCKHACTQLIVGSHDGGACCDLSVTSDTQDDFNHIMRDESLLELTSKTMEQYSNENNNETQA